MTPGPASYRHRSRPGNDDCNNNHFEYQAAVDVINPGDRQSDVDCSDADSSGALFPQAPGDEDGERLPFTGHIRKAYPRDDVSDDPSADARGDPACRTARQRLKESNTQTHRILRRGIPFGPVSPSTPEAPFDDGVVRGLHFLAYQTSIQEQFEFITTCWVNNPNFKEPFGHNPESGGHDPIIGQNNAPDEDRVREFTVAFTDGGGTRRRRQPAAKTRSSRGDS